MQCEGVDDVGEHDIAVEADELVNDERDEEDGGERLKADELRDCVAAMLRDLLCLRKVVILS